MRHRLPYRTPIDDSREIVLRLEEYDDIFSDFDMRPYSARAISVDFLDEVKRAVLDKPDEGIVLTMYVPKKRNEHRELMIKERLRQHFKRHYTLAARHRQRVIRLGGVMVVLGVICMAFATLLVHNNPSHSVWRSFFLVFLEPAAWFLLWEGMDQIIFNARNINPQLDFYRKMSHAEARMRFKAY